MATHTFKGQFSGLLTCANCGKHFRRRIANASSKYAKPAWLCSTFATKGKRYCNNKQIPEVTLIDKTKDVLGLHSLDGVDLRSYISEIICYQNQELTFILTNGDKIRVMHCCRKPTLSTISQKQSRKTMVKLSSITSLIRTKQSSMKMFSIWYKLNYSDALKCAEVSEIAVHSAQNWSAEIAVHFMGIKSTTPKKSIVRMYGIAITATRAATTAPRQFLPRMIW